MEDRESAILNLLKSEPGLTRAQMGEKIGCSEATIKRTLQNMIKKNLIRRIGPNKNGEWIIM
ncbi:MAG: winged helix-turn-helix transcriptional regulator [Saccharofermentans sp.]|nr:winged helix-turn-helix transcriptional regulator [Saccharofermentans sp.]